MYLSFYSPFALADSQIDGTDVPFSRQREFGYHVYSRYLSIPPGGSVTVVLDLAGQLAVGDRLPAGRGRAAHGDARFAPRRR